MVLANCTCYDLDVLIHPIQKNVKMVVTLDRAQRLVKSVLLVFNVRMTEWRRLLLVVMVPMQTLLV